MDDYVVVKWADIESWSAFICLRLCICPGIALSKIFAFIIILNESFQQSHLFLYFLSLPLLDEA